MKLRDLRDKSILRTTVLGLIVILFFVGIVFGYYHMLYQQKRSNIIQAGRILARQSANQFEAYLSTNIDLVKFTAYTLDEMIREGKTEAEIQDYLVGQSTAIRNAVLENSTGLYGYIGGRFYSGTNWEPPADYVATERPWYTKPMENPGQLTILEPYVDVQSGNTMLALGKTLCDGESVISVDVSLEQMQILTEQAVSQDDSDIEMILTGDGTVVTHSDRGEVGKNYAEESGTLGEEITRRLTDRGTESYYEFDHDWEHYIVYDARFHDDWHCLSVHNATDVFASLNQIFVTTIAVVIVMVLILGTMLAVSGRRALAARQAVAANEARTEFLSRMSHEIRTPIHAVLGMNEMILRESRESRIRNYAGKVKSSGEELLKLVDELFRFSGAESGKAGIGKGQPFTAPQASALAVDDNPMNLEVLKSLLKRTGIRIDTAGSGEEGLLLTKSKKYDIIFLDYMMPDKDGIETLHELRAQMRNPNHQIPVICLTADVTERAREKYLSEGFSDYATKPIDPARLEELLLKYLPEDKILPGGEEEQTDAEIQTDDGIPETLRPLAGVREIDVNAGIRNSGSLQAYLPLLKIFYTSIDESCRELERLLADGEFGNYTIKIHALKSSARIIGAVTLGDRAQALEDAGKNGDTEYIRAHHAEWIAACRNLSGPLAEIFPEEGDQPSKPEADPELMSEAVKELRSAADDMDCDRLQTILAELADYRVPDRHAAWWKEIEEAVNNYEYSLILKLVDQYADR